MFEKGKDFLSVFSKATRETFEKFGIEIREMPKGQPLFFGIPIKVEENVFALFKEGKEIFRGTKKEVQALATKLDSISDDFVKEYLELLAKEKQLIRERNLIFDGQNWHWENPLGTNLRWSRLSKKVLLENIEFALKRAVEDGEIFEANVAKKMSQLVEKQADEIIDFSNNILNKKTKRLNGDIDCATHKYIIEAKHDLANISNIEGLEKQIQKYLPQNESRIGKYMNPLNKKVVVVYDTLGNYTLNNPILKKLQNQGVIFIEGIDNLKKLY